MSAARNTGGPAFPREDYQWDDAPGQKGMTLRDYFAAKAMQAQLITDGVPGEACDALLADAAARGQDPIQRLACASYEVADAMLAAREAA